MNTDKLTELTRRIVPDLAGGPFYLVPCDAAGLPAQYRGFGWLGLHSSWLDVALSNWLQDRGEWQGRGPAVVVNTTSLRTDAERDAGTDQAFADELYRGRLTAVLVHELAHAVETPIDRTEYSDLATASLQAAATVRRWAANEYTPPAAPWHGHAGGWLRLTAHVQYRAEQFIGERLPTPWVCGDGYGLTSYLAYRAALGDEPERLRDQTFETIRAETPPPKFVELWQRDVREWFSSFTEPAAGATEEVVRSLRLFTTEETDQMSTVLDKVAAAVADQRRQAETAFRKLAETIVDGKEPTTKQATEALQAAGRTIEDLRVEVERIRHRRELRTAADRRPALETELEDLKNRISKTQAEFERLQKEHADKLRPLQGRTAEVVREIGRSADALRQLQQDSDDPVLRDRLAEIAAARRKLEAEERELDDRLHRVRTQASEAGREPGTAYERQQRNETLGARIVELEKQRAGLHVAAERLLAEESEVVAKMQAA